MSNRMKLFVAQLVLFCLVFALAIAMRAEIAAYYCSYFPGLCK